MRMAHTAHTHSAQLCVSQVVFGEEIPPQDMRGRAEAEMGQVWVVVVAWGCAGHVEEGMIDGMGWGMVRGPHLVKRGHFLLKDR